MDTNAHYQGREGGAKETAVAQLYGIRPKKTKKSS